MPLGGSDETAPVAEAPAGASPDDDLLERLGQADPAAFARLVELHFQPVYRVAWRMLGGRDGAEDIAQEAFLRLWRNPRQVRDGKALKSWLRARGIGRLEVKKRGVELDPAHVQRNLYVPGDEEATLLLCRMDNKITAIFARRRASKNRHRRNAHRKRTTVTASAITAATTLTKVIPMETPKRVPPPRSSEMGRKNAP